MVWITRYLTYLIGCKERVLIKERWVNRNGGHGWKRKRMCVCSRVKGWEGGENKGGTKRHTLRKDDYNHLYLSRTLGLDISHNAYLPLSFSPSLKRTCWGWRGRHTRAIC